MRRDLSPTLHGDAWCIFDFAAFAVVNYGDVSGTSQKAAYPGEAILWKYAVGKELD